MNCKADANMWWIIIGAVIALVVLIILMLIFTGKTGKLQEGVSACEGNSGVCISSGSMCPSASLKTSTFGCSISGQECCIGTPKKCGSDAVCGGIENSCRSEGSKEKYCYT